MKNSIMTILPIVFILDLLIPFILAPAYKGYNHLIQVMSVLGNSKAPLHIIYNAWLVVFGITLIVIDFNIGCFILAILCFSCFVMGDKPNYKNTVLAFEGLWQRLSLLFMYLPLGCLILLEK